MTKLENFANLKHVFLNKVNDFEPTRGSIEFSSTFYINAPYYRHARTHRVMVAAMLEYRTFFCFVMSRFQNIRSRFVENVQFAIPSETFEMFNFVG